MLTVNMSNVYTVFNTTSEHEFSKFFDKLDLTPNELLNVISEMDEIMKEKFKTNVRIL